MNLRFLGEKPRMSGKERFKSAARRSMTFRPSFRGPAGTEFRDRFANKEGRLLVNSQGCPDLGSLDPLL